MERNDNNDIMFWDKIGEFRYMKQNKEIAYHTHISSEHHWYEINLREIWLYRDLIMLFTKRNFILTFKQTILGPIWIFLNPFITSIIFTVVFGGIAGISTNGIPQILFYLCSNALWGFFSECVSRNSSTFVTNAAVFGKIYFPRITVPISNAISSGIRFMIQMILVFVFFVYYLMKGMVYPNWPAWLFLPLVLIQLGLMGIGVGIIVSSLTTKYRDLMIVVGFGISLWMYATPIVYPLSQLGNGVLKTILMINPVTMPVELFRYAVLGQGVVISECYVLSWLITIVVTILGMIMFTRVEKTFMDTV